MKCRRTQQGMASECLGSASLECCRKCLQDNPCMMAGQRCQCKCQYHKEAACSSREEHSSQELQSVDCLQRLMEFQRHQELSDQSGKAMDRSSLQCMGWQETCHQSQGSSSLEDKQRNRSIGMHACKDLAGRPRMTEVFRVLLCLVQLRRRCLVRL